MGVRVCTYVVCDSVRALDALFEHVERSGTSTGLEAIPARRTRRLLLDAEKRDFFVHFLFLVEVIGARAPFMITVIPGGGNHDRRGHHHRRRVMCLLCCSISYEIHDFFFLK